MRPLGCHYFAEPKINNGARFIIGCHHGFFSTPCMFDLQLCLDLFGGRPLHRQFATGANASIPELKALLVRYHGGYVGVVQPCSVPSSSLWDWFRLLTKGICHLVDPCHALVGDSTRFVSVHRPLACVDDDLCISSTPFPPFSFVLLLHPKVSFLTMVWVVVQGGALSPGFHLELYIDDLLPAKSCGGRWTRMRRRWRTASVAKEPTCRSILRNIAST